jgi:hypothetical protein
MLDAKFRGGAVFLKIIYDTIFAMTTQVECVLQSWIKNFAHEGILGVPGKNVRYVYNAALYIVARLKETNALSGDADVDILRGLTLATKKKFTAPFITLESLHDQDVIVLGTLAFLSTYERCMKYLTQVLDSWLLYPRWNMVCGKHFFGYWSGPRLLELW